MVAVRIFAAVGIVLAAMSMAALAVVYFMTMLSTIDDYDEAEREYAQLQCLGDIVLTEVPIDALVFVADWSGPKYGNWLVDELWLERITELTILTRIW